MRTKARRGRSTTYTQTTTALTSERRNEKPATAECACCPTGAPPSVQNQAGNAVRQCTQFRHTDEKETCTCGGSGGFRFWTKNTMQTKPKPPLEQSAAEQRSITSPGASHSRQGQTCMHACRHHSGATAGRRPTTPDTSPAAARLSHTGACRRGRRELPGALPGLSTVQTNLAPSLTRSHTHTR